MEKTLQRILEVKEVGFFFLFSILLRTRKRLSPRDAYQLCIPLGRSENFANFEDCFKLLRFFDCGQELQLNQAEVKAVYEYDPQ